jgi:hypothetical protein
MFGPASVDDGSYTLGIDFPIRLALGTLAVALVVGEVDCPARVLSRRLVLVVVGEPSLDLL